MNLTVRTITTEVANYYKIDILVIYSVRRKSELVKYKHIAIYFINLYLGIKLISEEKRIFSEGLSHRVIGKEFPGKGKKGCLDRCSIIHAVKSVQNQYDTNSAYRMEINEIHARLESLNVHKAEDETFQENDFYTELEIQKELLSL